MPISNVNSWVEAQETEQQRTFKRALAISFALHIGVAVAVVIAPKPEPVRMPSVISVRMVAAPSAAAPAAPVKAASKKAPAPAPVPAKPAPPPAAKKVILPKRSVVTKKSKPKPKPLEYDDALAALRDELGEETPVPAAVPEPQENVQTEEVSESGVAEASGVESGVEVDPAILAWKIATKRHLRRFLVVPKDFMNKSLSTDVLVTVTSTGEVLGFDITRPSSDPYWDDIVRRTWASASPLPPPPNPGDWPFRFIPEEGN